ncbi:MAG: hypothetical protein J6T57_04245 [Alphaproteobacteria bacterium]|nr:hypothetical protein [Alphaproteobacteria bacterium]
MKHTFLFATIASILSINAYAVSATVTSKDYVDTTRQATIPAARTNASTPGDTVVTYTDTAGVIGERFICDAYNNGDGDCNADDLVARDVLDQMIPTGTADTVVMYNNNGDIGGERGIYDGSTIYNSSTDSDKLVTAAALQSATNSVENNLPTTTVTYKTCTEWSGTPHTDANCLLWNLSDKPVYGNCTSHSDCSSLDCDFEHTGAWAGCMNGRCECVIL